MTATTATTATTSSGVPQIGSYKSLNTVASEGIFAFLNGCGVGAIWGCVTPFFPPGTSDAVIRKSKNGILPPFSSLSAVGHNAMVFGGIFAVQRLSTKWLELLRGREDFYNDVFGFATVYPYYRCIIGHSDRRLIAHNRVLGSAMAISVIYGFYLGC
mmetsp:Transcript_13089/g.28391  ORF Transcript_13089/g.28391 Transcript_13089/m.28391 type:complete len:157 (-) Transcript_13089:97-567(-)|eukprot:CAMPEP_0178472022 /NCGR_PEP_ID=MMETSP0696-20121128/1351_1 /TAXON_ID=265572 /ORGANISM="Extubocellulus spinifer, Strain CCMP396" /LENGTH=156 /DNA_ID=CAMNT_0020099189 /DNA_START=212 /DNA_END=682 /DNA_ORIENTATION=-